MAPLSPSPHHCHSLSGMHYSDLPQPALYTKMHCLFPAPGSAPGQPGCCLELFCATGTSQSCPQTAQTVFYHGQAALMLAQARAQGPLPALLGPCPGRSCLSPEDMSSGAVHQTNTGSYPEENPCLQPPANTLDQPQSSGTSLSRWGLLQLKTSKHPTGGRMIWQWIKSPERFCAK